MKKNYPLISIVTINYNQADVTNQLLKSLSEITWPNIEIILVDNNSRKENYLKLNASYKNVKIIRTHKNLGFAGGNNVGMKQANGSYILLLNNDTEVPTGFIEPMVRLFENNNSIGAVSPKIKYFSQPEIIQYAGFTKMNPFTLRMKAVGNKQMDNGSFNTVEETAFAHGCAMMIPKRVLNNVGPMHEDYFLYYEEHDWSNAIKKAGYKIYFQPESEVYHKESISIQKNSPLKTYFLNRNRILYMRRNLNWLNRISSMFYLLTVSIPKNVLSYTFKKEKDHLYAYLDALVWNVTNTTKSKWNL